MLSKLKRLFKLLFYIVGSYLAVIGLLFLLLVGSIMSLVQADFDTSSIVSQDVDFDKGGIKIHIDGPIVENSAQSSREMFEEFIYGSRKHSLSSLKRALKRAEKDDRIKTVWLNIDRFETSFANATALRSQIVNFRKTGKKVYVNLNTADTLTYYLASAADQISIQPLGEVFMPGASFNLTFFGSAIKKLGFELEVVRVGKFKSFMEPYIMDAPSKASRQMYLSLAQSLNGELTKKIALSRNVDEARVMSWIKKSYHKSQEALEAGLVDKVSYEEDVEKVLKDEGQLEDFISYKDYLNATNGLDEENKTEDDAKIALINAIGEIRMSSNDNGSQLITPENTIKKLRWAASEEDVKAVVLRVDSPGGSALAADMIWNEVKKLAQKKKVVVSMGAVAASGGYYISAPAHMIIAQPTTVTGSIGVIGAIPNAKNVGKEWGVNFHLITQSDRSRLLNFSTRMSQADKRIIQSSTDLVYDTFIQKVASGRKMTKEAVNDIAQGRVWTGAQGLENKLVDKLGGLDLAFTQAKILGGLDAKKLYPIARYKPESMSFSDCLKSGDFSECLSDMGMSLSLDTHLSHALDSYAKLEGMIRDDYRQMYLPVTVNWNTSVGVGK